jgi:hypothetical protein
LRTPDAAGATVKLVALCRSGPTAPATQGERCNGARSASGHAFWTTETGIDGQTPVDLDDLELVGIGPLPSWIWYQDMADFAEAITDERAGRRLARAIQGQGAFRRFKDELHQEYPDLLPAWLGDGLS